MLAEPKPVNPDALRTALPPYRQFKAPNSEAVKRYLHYYGLDFVASNTAQRQTIGWFKSNNFQLVAQAFFANNATANAIIVHGYMDHSGLFSKLIAHLLSRNVNVYITDLPGHGLSTGVSASINDFAHYTQAISQLQQLSLAQCADGPWYLFGQSMGGSICMQLMQEQAFAIRRVGLLAPLVQPRAWSGLQLLHSALKSFVSTIPRGFTPNSHDLEFCDFIKHKDPLQTRTIPIDWINAMRRWRNTFLQAETCDTPILLIQGSADLTTDWRYGNKCIRRLFPNHQQVIIPDGKHHLANEATPYITQVFAAIDGLLRD